MESLKNTTDKNKINIQYDDIKKVTMRYGRPLSKYIGLDIDSGTLEFRYCVSPAVGGRPYPKDYFDVKSLVLKKKYIQYAKELIVKCLNKLTFDKPSDRPVPDGFYSKVSFGLKDNDGQVYFCEKLHDSNTEECFMELFVFLEKQCLFPYKRFSKRMFPREYFFTRRERWQNILCRYLRFWKISVHFHIFCMKNLVRMNYYST